MAPVSWGFALRCFWRHDNVGRPLLDDSDGRLLLPLDRTIYGALRATVSSASGELEQIESLLGHVFIRRVTPSNRPAGSLAKSMKRARVHEWACDLANARAPAPERFGEARPMVR